MKKKPENKKERKNDADDLLVITQSSDGRLLTCYENDPYNLYYTTHHTYFQSQGRFLFASLFNLHVFMRFHSFKIKTPHF